MQRKLESGYMLRQMCKAKLHGATVIEANLNYVGSITIDQNLMGAADIIPFEWVHVANVQNGARFETYVIPGERGSGMIALNGATARLGQPGDKLIIMCYGLFAPEELIDFAPRLVFLDAHNKPFDLSNTETAQQTFHVGDTPGLES